MLYEYKCIIRSITDGDGLRVDIDLGFGVVRVDRDWETQVDVHT